MSRTAKILSVLLLCALCLGGGFCLGRSTAPNAPILQEVTGRTFYAAIDSLSETGMQVTGLPVNSLNFQSSFTFSVDADTRLEWNYTEITMADLQVGDPVAITFTGGIRESLPAQLDRVLRIELLEHSLER